MSRKIFNRWGKLAGLLNESNEFDAYEADGMDEYGNPLPSNEFFQTADEISDAELEQAVEEALDIAEEEFGPVEELETEDILTVFLEQNPIDYIYDDEGHEIIDITPAGEPIYPDERPIVEAALAGTFAAASLVKFLFGGKVLAPTLGFITLGGSGAAQRIIDMINDVKKARSARKISPEATTAMRGTSSGGGGAAGQVAVKNHIITCLLNAGVPPDQIQVDTAGIGSHIPDVLLRPATIQWMIANKNSLSPQGKAAASKLSSLSTTGVAFEVKSDQGTVDYPVVTAHQKSKYDFTTLPATDAGVKAHRAAIVSKLSTPDSHGSVTFPPDAYYIITDPLFDKIAVVKMANYDQTLDELFFGQSFTSIGYAGMANTYENTVDGRPRRGGYVASTPKFSNLKSPWVKLTTLGDTSLAIEQLMKDQHYGTTKDGSMSAIQETGRKIAQEIQAHSYKKSEWGGSWGKWNELTYDQYVNLISTTTVLGDVAGGNFTAKGGDQGITRIARGSLDKVYTNPSPAERKEYMFDVFVKYWPQAIKNALESELFRYNQNNPGNELLPRSAEEKTAALAIVRQIAAAKGWNPDWFESVGDDVYQKGYNKAVLPESHERFIDDAINEALSNWKRLIR